MVFPADFSTDGCTGFLDVWRGIDLYACCVQHDLAWHLHPGDWSMWFWSNVELAQCFAAVGAWEIAVFGFLVVSTAGAALFARNRRTRS
jgi:hypothetical protein